jgi:hypothetical protein
LGFRNMQEKLKNIILHLLFLCFLFLKNNRHNLTEEVVLHQKSSQFAIHNF